MKRRLEDWAPCISSGFIVFMFVLVDCFTSFPLILSKEKFLSVLEVTINITAILVGFISTMIAMISSMSAKKLFLCLDFLLYYSNDIFFSSNLFYVTNY